MTANEIVLVTGGSGHVAIFSIYRLLQKGYSVRTTIRNKSRADQIKKHILALRTYQHVSDANDVDLVEVTEKVINDKVSFYETDLEKSSGWEEAVSGVDYIQHIASPTTTADDNTVNVSRDGTLRLLKLANKYKVKRLVLMSSAAAISYTGAKPDPKGKVPKITESDWSIPQETPNAYAKSKLIQERAAWDWINSKENTSGLEMTSLNPTAIMGPNIPGQKCVAAEHIVSGFVDGRMKFGVPRIFMGTTDVRDIAYINERAIHVPEARNERFILQCDNSPTLKWFDYSQMLKKHYSSPQSNGKVIVGNLPARELPSGLIRFLAHFISTVKLAVPYLDTQRETQNDKAKRVFKWQPLATKEALLATVETL
ncbi:uncharacterized protein RJT20DRAFT_65326 [Scheffersomyces xylosifermentans]|uniref:uncharacterized protein n=1 Tax=Scheffersomyces xylosifermentans TaxID=1304137 RepID=UPI00315D499E